MNPGMKKAGLASPAKSFHPTKGCAVSINQNAHEGTPIFWAAPDLDGAA